MIAQIATQTPQPTEAPRSQTGDAKGQKGTFAGILDNVRSQDARSPRDANEAQDAPRDAKADPTNGVAVVFMRPLSEDAAPTGARSEAEQALMAAAEAMAADADGTPLAGEAGTEASTSENGAGDFSELLDPAQADAEGQTAADVDATQDSETEIRVGQGGRGQEGDADKLDADKLAAEKLTAEKPGGKHAEQTDDQLNAQRAPAQQPGQGTEAARHGAHGIELQQMQVEAKPLHIAAAQATAQPHPTTQAVNVPLDGVAVQVAKAAIDGIDRLRIELHPASLGGVDISLEIGRDGRVDAVVRADRPETLELLQRDARQLARALQDAGLQADSGSFAFQRRDEGGQQPSLFADKGGPHSAGREDRGMAADTIYRTVRPSGVDLRV